MRRRHVKIFAFCGGFEIRRASNNNVASYFMSTLNIYAFIARDDGNFQWLQLLEDAADREAAGSG